MRCVDVIPSIWWPIACRRQRRHGSVFDAVVTVDRECLASFHSSIFVSFIFKSFPQFQFLFPFLKRWLKGVVSRLRRLVQFADDLLKKGDPLFLSMPQSDRQWTKLLDVPGSIWFFLAPLWLSGWNQPSEWTLKFHHHLAVNEIPY